MPLPLVLGHEWVGVVDAVGSDLYAQLIGQRVVGEINITCRSRHSEDPCAACRAALESHCQVRTVMGIVGADGVFASDVLVPAANLRPVPHTVLDEHAVFVEPLAAALQTFEITPTYPGERVVVLGAGRLGALIVQVAKLRGAHVVAVSRSGEKRRRAKKLGAREALPVSPKLPAQVRDLFDGLGADLVVEATGSPEGLPMALELVRPRGTISIKTTCGLPSSIDTTRMVVNEVQIASSRCGPFGKALNWLRDGRLKLSGLLGERFPFSRIEAAMVAARGSRKVLLEPD
ncbi:MAG: zinc-binding dehydrogenase [Candidatus Riflebacteria bacterium]|nr:zinc-binding dehydrogenase [Candidatus Riflebacteria bacterium]